MHIIPFDVPREPDRMESSSSIAVEASASVRSVSFPALSFVSRAKIALHSAAARAEKALTDIKADLKTDRDGDGQAKRDSKIMEGQVLTGCDGFSNPSEEISEACFATKQDVNNFSNKLTVPPTSVLKKLAAAYEAGKNFICSKNISYLVEGPLPTREKSGLSFTAVKSLVLREKGGKSFSDFSDEELHSLMQQLFNSEKSYYHADSGSCLTCSPMTYMLKIRGAPPESFTVKLSEVIGSFESLKKMTSFWCCVVIELRRLWSEGLPVPRMPLDASPELNSCLLHQQLQEASLDNKDLVDSPGKSNSLKYARLASGEYVLRLGADHLSESLSMLETGEPIYSPVTQEGPILTDELIKETEELILRTGSFGAGCSQLLSDMQAFKAANPGCVLEDFIRWHSPPDWTITETCKATDSIDGEGSSRRGSLSKRMLTEGNLWQELWRSAKAMPAVQQTPVFDEDLAVENIFNTLEDIRPSELFEQLFVSMVYETVETIVTHPEEAISIVDQTEEESSLHEAPKNRFKRINFKFIKKETSLLRKKPSKDEKKSEEKQLHAFSQLFAKKSLFSKKPPKHERA